MDDQQTSAVVLAAGKGTRMKSPLPKVLHPVAGRPMIVRVIDSLKKSGVTDIRVIVGYGEKLVRQLVEPLGVSCYLQSEQKGTADAVGCGQLNTTLERTLIVNGDHPLVRPEDFVQLMERFEQDKLDLAVASVILKKPASFGRIVRYHGKLHSIVEARDASAETMRICEVNTGLYLLDSDLLRQSLERVSSNNASGEFYLTDIVGIAREQGCQVDALELSSRVGFGVNDQMALAKATRAAFKLKARECLDAGVIIVDPKSTFIEDTVEISNGCMIGPGTHVKGNTKITANTVIEQNCHIDDCEIGSSVVIKAHSYLEQTVIEEDCVVGPFARLRVGTVLRKKSKVGNFVEMKKTDFGEGSKASHLAYIGDAEVGKDVNIGCGTITCNYSADRKKHKTKIGDGVFVGSDTQLVAPVTVGDRAVIGSGSTITRDVPEGALAVSRVRQVNREKYIKE